MAHDNIDLVFINMELLEYQAKELFRLVGIPILPAQTIKDSRKIKQLQIPYPVVLKSQVRSGGRGKAGGVRFVSNTIDAIAAARTIFNLSILGEYPEVILAEAHYNAEREFFLAIVLDYDLQLPVILGSALGGMNVESLLANLQQVVIEGEFSLFYARRLAAKMGLSGKMICSVSDIIAKMYGLFESKDLDLIEINPLGVNTKGELMALDGKITINEHAFSRQPVLETLNFSAHQKNVHRHHFLKLDQNVDPVNWNWLNWRNKTGKIAIISNSFDLALLTWDLLNEKRLVPACGVLLENRLGGQPDDFGAYQENLLQILSELKLIKGIRVIMLNIRETELVNQQIIEIISNYFQAQQSLSLLPKQENLEKNNPTNMSNSLAIQRESAVSQTDSLNNLPYFVLRLIGYNNIDLPLPKEIHLTNNLEAAITQAIAVVKSS